MTRLMTKVIWVCSSKLNQRADLKPIVAPPQLIEEFVPGLMLAIERARSGFAQQLQANLRYGVERPYAGVLIALVIGDQSGISQRQWALFNRTGIGHLVSISGLHITMIAGLFASLCGFPVAAFMFCRNRLAFAFAGAESDRHRGGFRSFGVCGTGRIWCARPAYFINADGDGDCCLTGEVRKPAKSYVWRCSSCY